MKRILVWLLCMSLVFTLPVSIGVAENIQAPALSREQGVVEEQAPQPNEEQPPVLQKEETISQLAQQTVATTQTSRETTPVFWVETVTARAGETVTVAMGVSNNPGIVSAKLALSYPADVLETVLLEAGDFSEVSFSPVQNNPVIVNFMDAIHPNNTTNGVLATVTFKVKETARAGDYDFTLSYDPADVFDYDLTPVSFALEQGKVLVKDYLPGDVNSDGAVNNKDLSLLLRYLNHWMVEMHKNAADVNGDGEITNIDFCLLQRYLNDWDVTLSYGNYVEPTVESLRVATYNIHYLSQTQGDLTAIAEMITNHQLQVVGLQEVDNNVGREGPVQDQAKALAEQLGWYYGYSKAVSLNGGEYGHAILSQYPIVSYQTVSLNSGAEEQRVMGHAVIAVGNQQVNLLNTHLSYQEMNQTQITQIRNYVASLESYILTGDFNTGNFVNLAQIDGKMTNNFQTTFQTSLEDGAVDNIFVKGYGASTGVMVQNSYSDHHLLYTDVDLYPDTQTVNGLRVGTYNIRHLADVGGDATVIANFILQQNLDVVGLQEVDNNVGRDGPVQNQVKAIAEALGWYWGFSKAIDLSGGEYGHGIISKYPIEAFSTFALQSGAEEGRAMGHAVLNVAGKKVNFLNVHLSWQEMTGAQINQVANHAKGYGKYIVVGDFNAEYDELTPIAGSMVNNAADRFVTNLEDGCIDNIIVNGFTVGKGTMVESSYSDHSLLYADVNF